MSDTLVIHPKDKTTDCLSVIYEGKGWDVIRDYDTPLKEVWKQIRTHKRIVMLGHGTPDGLLAGGKVSYIGFDNREWTYFTRFHHYIVREEMLNLLSTKETYSIWCNSDKFFEKKGIKGFHTGMIISEVSEEKYILDKVVLSEEEMAKNMELFCGTCAKYFDLPPEEAQKKILEEYVGDDEVTQYNRGNIKVL